MRFSKITLALGLLALAHAGSGSCLAQNQNSSRPNVVVLISDDQGFGDYGFMGHDMLDVNRPQDSLRSRSCVQKDWKLTLWHELHPDLEIKEWQMPTPAAQVQLFDLVDDPMERNSLANKHPEKVAALTRKLNAWWNP